MKLYSGASVTRFVVNWGGLSARVLGAAFVFLVWGLTPAAAQLSGPATDAAAHAAASAPAAPAAMAPIPDEANPAKADGPLNVHVFGDSLGDGVWAGLYRKLPKADGYKVTKHSRVSTGLVRKDFYDWSKAVRQIVAAHRVDVAVVMIGTNDRQAIVENGRHALRSATWEKIYKARIDDLTQVLKDEGAQVFWVELPAMRSPRFGRDMQYFNSLFEERAAANGITYVPTWQRTLGDNGAYSAYGTDDRGRKRKMRTNDGIHFTMSGYIKLAGFVTDAMADVPGQQSDAQPAADVIPASVKTPVAPVSPALPEVTAPEIAAPAPVARPARSEIMPSELDGQPEGVQRSERAGVSEVASGIAHALSELRGFVLPEAKPGRADDLRQPQGTSPSDPQPGQ